MNGGKPVMTVRVSRILGTLTEEQRHRVLERAAVLHADGVEWADADDRALELEGVVHPSLPGVSA